MVQRAGNAAGMGKAKKDGGKVVSGSTWSAVKQRIKMLQGDNAGGKVRSMQEVIDNESSRGRLAQGRRGVSSKLSKRGIGQDKNGVPGVEEDESGQSDGSRGRGRKWKASSRKEGISEKVQDPVESEAADDTDTDDAEDEDTEKLYEVQAIRRKRVRQGNVEFLVKWQGWPEKDNTWEPYDHVGHLLDHYESKQGARKRGGVKRKTYRPRKAKHSSMSYRNSTAATSDSATITETRVPSMGLQSRIPTSPRRTGGSSSKKPTVTPLKVGTSDDTDEDVRPEIRRTDHESSEPLVGSFQSNSNPGEGEEHVPMDTENSGGGSDILNADGNRSNPCTTTDSVKATNLESDVLKCTDTKGSVELHPRDSETWHVNGSREGNSQVPQEAHAATEVAVQAVEPGPGDYGREGEVLDGESPAASADLPVVSNGIPNMTGSPQTEECTVTEDHAKDDDDQMVGAKRRKSGCVKRVRLSSDTVDDKKSPLLEGSQWEVARLVDGAISREVGTAGVQSLASAAIVRPGQEDTVAVSRHAQIAVCTGTPAAQVSGDSMSDRPPYVVEIVKAISYNQTVINGKQDVMVIFRALSSDGQEVFVNNKEMRDRYPMLLIDFYEQHLRYSNTQ